MLPTVNEIITDVPAPAKRGRKPGPLSRSAREAQRRLNHSIIEKARRTKINDALATLRQLVPVDYNSTPHPHNDSREEEDDDDDDDEYHEDGTKRTKPKAKPKGTGKREEKEKEFKLEILVRTVAFLQDLLKRVDTMEKSSPVCHRCAAPATEASNKRKYAYDENDSDHTSRKSKVPRQSSRSQSISSIPATEPQQTNGNGSGRLPSISSWLPDSVIDPNLLSPQNKPISPTMSIRYLPSPPASTHFDPIRTPQQPPVLNLGPVATAAMVTLPRTSEDESAASLLLQIATSPPFRPSPPTNSNYNLPDPSKFMLHSDVRSQRAGHLRHPQTPASLLGLHHERKY